MPPPSITDDLRDGFCAVLRPLQLGCHLRRRRVPPQLSPQCELRQLEVLSRLHQPPALLLGPVLLRDRLLHVVADLFAGEGFEVSPAASRKLVDRLDEAETAFLDEVALTQPATRPLAGSLLDPLELVPDQRLFGLRVSPCRRFDKANISTAGRRCSTFYIASGDVPPIWREVVPWVLA